jgi:hypothetical protein
MKLKLIEILCPFFLAYFTAELIAPNVHQLCDGLDFCGSSAETKAE